MITVKKSLISEQNFVTNYFIKLIPAALWLTALFVLISMHVTTKAQAISDEIILAKVGSKEITLKEFKIRSELTVRPNNFKDKYITLNNLISEKILAIESEKKNDPASHTAFQNKLKGIREQMMRDKLFNSEAFNKVVLDSNEIRSVYRNSLREYELEFYTINDDSLRRKIDETIKSAPELTNDIFNELQNIVGNKPIHKTKYLDPDDQILTEALFTTLLDTGAVIGPLRISNGDYILMRVNSWTDSPVIGYVDQHERWNKVEEKMHQHKVGKLWRQYISNLMRGHKIDFNTESFRILSDIAFEYYSKNTQTDSLYNQLNDNPSFEPDIDLNAPFFTIDNKTWTVAEFKNEINVHPLVFRTKDLNRKNFDDHFKYAIADMIRDYYLTQEAYKNSFDKSGDVDKTVNMWSDSFWAADEQIDVVGSAIESGIVNENDNSGKLKYWESYLSELQKKYADSISVNGDALKKINLTSIDMLAVRPGVPYPVAVPKFPVLISSDKLDYVKQWEGIKN
ncbi:MAG: hypothetical protein V1720_20880 [bacterium]